MVQLSTPWGEALFVELLWPLVSFTGLFEQFFSPVQPAFCAVKIYIIEFKFFSRLKSYCTAEYIMVAYYFYAFVRPDAWAEAKNVLDLSFRPSVTRVFWHKWTTRQTINFGDQEVKVQGHTRPKIDLQAWQIEVSFSTSLGRVVFFKVYFVDTYSLLSFKCCNLSLWQAGGENRQTWQLANPAWYT